MFKRMFKKTHTKHDKTNAANQEAPNIPEGMWRKCKKCGQPVYAEDVRNNYYCCPKCGGYFRMHAYRRVEMLADAGSFVEWDVDIPVNNPLDFDGYVEKLSEAREKTHLNEAVVTGHISIEGIPVVVGISDARFLMGSMGSVVGEKITKAIERATEERLPVILYTCSGGARMQEGIVSLMQMAKTSAAMKRHHEAGLLSVNVLTDPTTGGVTASYAMLADIILAEPGALIGFAGPRVIEQTIKQKLPEGFQRAEFLEENGFVDRVVPRNEQKDLLVKLLKMHKTVLPGFVESEDTGYMTEPKALAELSAWDRVQLSRKHGRPTASDYINCLFMDFIELKGDRLYGDDHAVIGGIADFEGIPVTVIGLEKGKKTKENIFRNFGMPNPEGYRKALRLMKQAEKFKRPVICFVDTPGAFCGLEAEERGQGSAIAHNLFEMADIKVPVVSIFIGEGGSGGALALAVADEVWMLENACYSILSPEGFASILWKDSKRKTEAAKVMKLTALDLLEMNIINKIIPEPDPVSEKNLMEVTSIIRDRLKGFLMHFGRMPEDELISLRYERFRNM